jgi:hypothetical protein
LRCGILHVRNLWHELIDWIAWGMPLWLRASLVILLLGGMLAIALATM